MSEAPRIQPGERVSLHCSLALADGTEVLSTFDEAPLAFTLGDGTLIPALEAHLLGMTSGEQQTFLLGPEMAYGPRDEAQIHELPLSDFSQPPAPGQILSFALPNGEETAARVCEVDGQRAKVDFNHPLSGHNLVFRVAILAVGPEAA